MNYWINRFAFKIIEFFLRFCTWLRYIKESDPSQVLIDNFTQLQWEHIARSQNNGTIADLVDLSEGVCLPKTLIVVPFRDKWNLTSQLLRSIEMQDCFASMFSKNLLRIALVDNGSHEKNTLENLEIYGNHPQWTDLFRVLHLNVPFNFSFINNKAVELSKDFQAETLLFLNNDVYFRNKQDLRALLLKTLDKQVGAVGCTLLYPNEKVQHLFLAPGVKIVGAHPLRGESWSKLCAWRKQNWPVAAVTGAVLAVRRQAFEMVGGFEEALATAYQDLDLCLKLQRAGLVNWTLSNVSLVHLETATRKPQHNRNEVIFMYSKWGSWLTANSWYSNKISRWSEPPAFALGEGAYPWSKVI